MKGDITVTENTRYNGISAERLKQRDEAALSIIRNELTPRQQQVLMDYYGGEQNLSKLARRYGVAPSTVQRTLRRAQQRLHRFLQYRSDCDGGR